MNTEAKSRPLYENLDTSFVNLWALLRYLSSQGFVGRVHVELPDYAADVFANGTSTPLVREMDRGAGTDILEEAALHRLVLRARESSGSINVFEGADEAIPPGASEPSTAVDGPMAERDEFVIEMAEEMLAWTASFEAVSLPLSKHEEPSTETASTIPESQPSEQKQEPVIDLQVVSGGLIGAVERALIGAGADFAPIFRAVRLELADDYTFLDPVVLDRVAGRFEFASSVVAVTDEVPASAYVAGVSEALRRVVDYVATGDRARRVRERVGLELALLVRKHEPELTRSGFRAELDRIAGTKVV